ncbi:hypothetical protein DLH98_20055 [Vibrio parahaemolyticus]|uniref:hypothetical protein n=1 Tax=Vibrio parahaemolyticus TaxID=670 RepID=UPI0003F56552|nr:hypothetical protein [Vibrio parahaemolyticus]EGQ8927029.1 hypothetical protein [Vibrio parahaemolyticus]EGR2860100.1 hypothetical protein [Vibrio parahaemolyticus]EGR2947601.1 hypothetical protein [Vibrio parahaemolyticus]EGR3066378.1 hypothetical protein [Vibrio parahaemolyticus]EGR3137557.1 hypothetical protein [Vibrio parahaemolyticus]
MPVSEHYISQTVSDLAQEAQNHIRAQRKKTSAAYRAARQARVRECIGIHHAAIEAEKARLKAKGKPNPNYQIGFTKRRVLRDKENPRAVPLPTEFAMILKACEEFIDNPRRFHALYTWVPEMRNRQARELVARVLACLLANTDMISGRVGEPSPQGMKPLSYHQFHEDHALRFGKYIAPKSFNKAVGYLKRAGYYNSESINIPIGDSEGTVRGAPAYKQFSETFFNDLKVVRYKNVAESIIETRARQIKDGLRHAWVSFRDMANGVVQRYLNANKFEQVAESNLRVFEAYTPQISLNPH